jgi:hypothetical protein
MSSSLAAPKVPQAPIREARRLLEQLRGDIDEQQRTSSVELDEISADELEVLVYEIAEDLNWVSVGVNTDGVSRLLQRALGWLAAASDQADPERRNWAVAQALMFVRMALRRVSWATEFFYRIEVGRCRRWRSVHRWAAPRRPDRARRLRSRCVQRSRSSRGPPDHDDDDDSEGDGPPGTGRAD